MPYAYAALCRWGYVNDEYISLAADTTVKFHGRTPIEMYTDFMASFAAEFQVPCALCLMTYALCRMPMLPYALCLMLIERYTDVMAGFAGEFQVADVCWRMLTYADVCCADVC